MVFQETFFANPQASSDNLFRNAQSLDLISLLRENVPVQVSMVRPVIEKSDRDDNRS